MSFNGCHTKKSPCVLGNLETEPRSCGRQKQEGGRETLYVILAVGRKDHLTFLFQNLTYILELRNKCKAIKVG